MNAALSGLKAVFFDLDYTLYDQRQYLLGAISDVAARIAQRCDRDPSALTDSLRGLWEREGTDCRNLFNRWLELEDLLDPDHVRACVDAFHAHRPARLELFPSAHEVLESLRSRYRIGIVTDGHGGMQRSKIAALGLTSRVDRIVLPHELGMKKPDSRIFEHVLHQEGLSPHEMLYVGDHPIKDIVCASRAGVRTVRVRTGEFAALPEDPVHPATYTVDGLLELPVTGNPALMRAV